MARKRKGKRPSPPLSERPHCVPDHPVVSEHAMLRWLQRVHGVDPQLIVDEILGDGRGGLVYLLENGYIRMAGGVRLVVKNRVVVTVLD